jgi:hypothetical protein
MAADTVQPINSTSTQDIYYNYVVSAAMKLVVVGLGVFLIAFAVYTVSDPMSRARPWVSVRELKRGSTNIKKKQEMRTVIYATATGLTGIMFVLFGLGL